MFDKNGTELYDFCQLSEKPLVLKIVEQRLLGAKHIVSGHIKQVLKIRIKSSCLEFTALFPNQYKSMQSV